MKRWKRRIVRLTAIASVIGAFAVLLSTHSESRRNLGTTENFRLPEPAGRNLTEDAELEETAVFSENGRTLYVSAGGAVRLAEDETGKTLWRNTAEDDDIRLLGTEDAAVSPVSITYRYDGETDITLYSDTDAVMNEQYTAAYTEDESRLRVTYLFGEVGQSGILPYGITQDTMEKEILPKLTEEERDYLLRRYVLYTAETAKSIVLETCPGVKTTPLYYLEDCEAVAMKNKTTAYLGKAGMTEELFEEQCRQTGEKPVSYDESYLLTVEYWLENGDVMVNIPCEEMRYHPENPLTTVTLNGAATYAEKTEEGAYLLPAGSGALQHFSEGTERTHVYGYFGADDLQKETQTKEYTFPLPIYGMLREDGSGLLAVIEKGAAQAALTEKYSDGASQLTLSFRLLEYGDSSVTAQQTSTVFGGSAYTGDLTVRYRVVESGADVSALAKEYRELLKAQGKLPETVKNEDGLLVELIGNIPYSYQWGGLFPVTKDLVLTSWEETEEIVRTLGENGLKTSVKLSGYNEKGLFNQTPGRYRWASGLGKDRVRESALAVLTRLGTTYLDVNLPYSYAGRNRLLTGYDAQKKNARQANNRAATRTLRSQSTGDALSKAGTLQVVSPYWYTSYAKAYREGLDSRLGVSVGEAMLRLNTDFSEKHPINRSDALTALRESAALLAEDRAVMSRNPLADVLNDLTLAEDLSLMGEAAYPLSDYVPFVQMVLHGHVAYTSRPLNAAGDYRKALLEAAETGSIPKFTLAGRMDERIRETEYDYLYYVDWTKWKDTVLTDAAAMKELHDRFSGQEIAAHERRGSLAKTSYSDGAAVYVNYGEQEASWDGVSVPALGWTVF